MSTSTKEYVKWFRHSSPYINAHKGKTFVLMFGGDAVLSCNFASLIHDIALLNSLGVRLVIVHGARPQINNALEAAGLPINFHNNLRITPKESLTKILQAAGEVRFQLEALLSMGLINSPMHGSKIRVTSGNFITAQPTGVLEGVDLQYTGTVRKFDVQGIHQALDQQSLVLLSPLGFSPSGELFNLNAEEVAREAAETLCADKLIYMHHEEGIAHENGTLLRDISLTNAKRLLKGDVLKDESGTAQRLLAAAIHACENNVNRIHIINYNDDGALIQELYSRDGCGSLISNNSFEQVRSASIDDVGGILEIITPLEDSGVLVKRPREILEREINQFSVIERDGAIIACASINPIENSDMAELACLAVHSSYQKGARGKLLLSHVEKRAKQLNKNSLFVLTTQTAHWFLEQGFNEGVLTNLPEGKQAHYNLQRNSKVFLRNIAD